MKRFISLIIVMYFHSVFAQTLTPSVFNTDGGTGSIPSPTGSVTIYYNIGEPIFDDVKNTSANMRLTQGFLQPDIVGYGILQINTYTTAMTCQSANDASIVLNAIGDNSPFIYKWYKNGMLLQDTSSTLLNLAVGNYSYSVTDSKGNLRSSSVQVLSGEGTCNVIIHNAVSANGDGHNDFFHIEHIEDYPNNSVSIFNRWGNLVWEEQGYNNTSVAWKGEDRNGAVLSAGTYFFTVTIDNRKTTGWVELIR